MSIKAMTQVWDQPHSDPHVQLAMLAIASHCGTVFTEDEAVSIVLRYTNMAMINWLRLWQRALEDGYIVRIGSYETGRSFQFLSDYEDATMQQYVYLMADSDNRYKIGMSIEPHQRRAQIQETICKTVRIVHLIPTNYMRKAESDLHKRYADKQLHGEWFKLSDDDVSEICRIEMMHYEDEEVQS